MVGPGYAGGWSVSQSVVSNFTRYSGAQIHSLGQRAFHAVGSAKCVYEHTSLTHLTTSTKYTCGLSTSAANSRDFTVCSCSVCIPVSAFIVSCCLPCVLSYIVVCCFQFSIGLITFFDDYSSPVFLSPFEWVSVQILCWPVCKLCDSEWVCLQSSSDPCVSVLCLT